MEIQTYKLMMVRDNAVKLGDKLTNPADIPAIAGIYTLGMDREILGVIALDTKNQVIGINTVSMGTLDTSLVHPREIFKFAILANASSIILFHNHPSGDPTPSDADLNITRRIKQAGEIMGIAIQDHIIVTDDLNRYYSMLVKKVL